MALIENARRLAFLPLASGGAILFHVLSNRRFSKNRMISPRLSQTNETTMIKKIHFFTPAAALAFFLLPAHSAQAATLAINFHWSSDQMIAAGAEVDGITGWANSKMGNPKTNRDYVSLSDGAKYWQTSSSYWQPAIGDALNPIYRATMDVSYNAGVISGYASLVQFADLAGWMTANNYQSYNLILYTAAYGGADPIFGSFDLFSGDYSTTTNGADLSNSLGVINPTLTLSTNNRWYARDVVTGLTADNFLIASEKLDYTNSGGRGGIAAVALVGVPTIPEPSIALLGGLGLLPLLRRRR